MQILGISIDKPLLHLAFIEKNQRRKGFYLKSFPLNEIENVKQLYTPSFKGKISSTFSAKNLLMRTFEVNTASEKHLEQAIAFQAEALSHFDEKDLFSIPHIVKRLKDKTEIQLFTTPREVLREHLDSLEKINLDPDCVTASPLALTHYVKWKLPNLQNAFLLNLGSEEWTCVCIQNGEMKKFHSILGGTESLLAAFGEDRKKNLSAKEIIGAAKQIDLLEMQASLNSHLFSQLVSMKQEVSRIIYSFFLLYGQNPLLFTGQIDAFGQIQEYLEKELGDLICPNISPEISREEQKYAIPIGLVVGFNKNKVQFRKNEFFPKKIWKKAGLYSLSFITASLLIGGSCILMGNHILQTHQQKMASLLQENLNRWDPPLAEKIFAGSCNEEVFAGWNRSVAVHSKEYPYIARFPKVSEVLSWIYQHPVVLAAKQTEDPIVIQSIRYQLLRHPKIEAPKDPYEGKVEIEFTTKNPLNARKFHQSLHKGEGWVDSEQEIQWEPSENLYRTSFYLKKERYDA